MNKKFTILGIIFLASVLYAGQAPSRHPKLKSIFHLNETAGTNTYDSIGIATATLKNGATFVSGRFGNGVSCDGVNDLVEGAPPAVYKVQAPFSIAGWVFPKGTSGDGYNCVLCTQGIRMGLYYNGTYQAGLRHYDGNVSNEDVAPSTTAIPLYYWSHIAASKDATNTVRIYVNGKRVFQGNHPNAIQYATPAEATFGLCSPDGVGELLNGIIDDVVISTVEAMTDGEIKKLWSTGVGAHSVNEEN